MIQLWLELLEVSDEPGWRESLEQALEAHRRFVNSIETIFEPSGPNPNTGIPCISFSICHGLAGFSNALLCMRNSTFGEEALRISRKYVEAIVRADDARAGDERNPPWRELTVNYAALGRAGDLTTEYGYPVGYMKGAAGTASSLLAFATMSGVSNGTLPPLPDLTGTRHVEPS